MISTAILNALSDTMQVRVIGVSICMTDANRTYQFQSNFHIQNKQKSMLCWIKITENRSQFIPILKILL